MTNLTRMVGHPVNACLNSDTHLNRIVSENDNLRDESYYSINEEPEEVPMQICPTCKGEDDDCMECDGEGQIADESDNGLDFDANEWEDNL